MNPFWRNAPRFQFKFARSRPQAADGAANDDCWWHVTEITLDNLRASRKWKREMAVLDLAKEAEAAIRRRLKELAKVKREKAEQLRLLQEVADEMCAA